MRQYNLLYQAEEVSLNKPRRSLTTLILYNNGFSRFPDTFQQRFYVLTKIDLSNNWLVTIPTSFQANTPQLKIYYLITTRLKTSF